MIRNRILDIITGVGDFCLFWGWFVCGLGLFGLVLSFGLMLGVLCLFGGFVCVWFSVCVCLGFFGDFFVLESLFVCFFKSTT